MARWSPRSLRPKNAASNPERLPPDAPERWRALLGRKISIRYALKGDPEHTFSEAVGVIAGVSEADDPTITIMRRDGGTTVVASSSVLQGKVFPAPRA